MPIENLLAFKDKRVLLLQGPVGPFFRRLASDIGQLGSQVFKVNFNAGDAFFYRRGIPFRQPLSQLNHFLNALIQDHAIDTIVLFGDCRPIHMVAKEVASSLSIDVFVFEEGYLRPNHVTLEYMGVNGYSHLPKDVREHLFHHSKEDITPPAVVDVGKTYWYAAFWAVLYYITASLGRIRFPHYQHHRPLTVLEGLPWIRSAWRKWFFQWKERGVESRLIQSLSRDYFLVPLQLHNDAQISHHSDFADNETFIETVINSFAQHAPQDTHLVFKQHPFDRGYKDYSALIHRLTQHWGITERVLYIHDQYLPALIDHARGVVVINSTVGLSAVGQFRPVKVCGKSVYNMEHLTAQEPLDDFWRAAQLFKPNSIYIHQYLDYLSKHTQHNGSFYRRIPQCQHATGVLWSE